MEGSTFSECFDARKVYRHYEQIIHSWTVLNTCCICFCFCMNTCTKLAFLCFISWFSSLCIVWCLWLCCNIFAGNELRGVTEGWTEEIPTRFSAHSCIFQQLLHHAPSQTLLQPSTPYVNSSEFSFDAVCVLHYKI